MRWDDVVDLPDCPMTFGDLLDILLGSLSVPEAEEFAEELASCIRPGEYFG